MIASHGGVLAGAAATIVLGAILSIMGYEDLWNNTPRRQSAAKASSSAKRGARPRRKTRVRRAPARFDMRRARSRLTPFRGEPQGRG